MHTGQKLPYAKYLEVALVQRWYVCMYVYVHCVHSQVIGTHSHEFMNLSLVLVAKFYNFPLEGSD